MKRLLYVLAVFALLLPCGAAMAQDCIDVGLDASVIPGSPYNFLQLAWSVENCGTVPGRASFTFTLNRGLDLLGSVQFKAYLCAGVTYSGTLKLPVLCCIPAGTYTLCMAAELGTARDLACASIAIDEANNITAFSPIPAPIAVEPTTWGSIKAMYR